MQIKLLVGNRSYDLLGLQAHAVECHVPCDGFEWRAVGWLSKLLARTGLFRYLVVLQFDKKG